MNVDGDARTLPPDAALALLRTAQESLVNAAKHAGGGQAGISLRFGADQTTLTVTSPLPGDLPPGDGPPGGTCRRENGGRPITAPSSRRAR